MGDHKPIFVVSDLHIGDGGTRDNFAVDNKDQQFDLFLDHVCEQDGELIVLGDLFDFWQANVGNVIVRCLPMLDRLAEMRAAYVVGNHDALYSGEQEETLFSEIFSLEQNNYHFVKNGIHFIAVDHGCGKAYHENSVRPKAMAWIKETLNDISEKEPIVFFSHYPFGESVRYQTKNSSEVLELFTNKRLLAMVSGHFHGNTERRENGILMTTTACCSGRRGNHDGTKAKGYRVFYIDNEMNVTTEFKEVN